MTLRISDEQRCELLFNIAKQISVFCNDKSENDIYRAIEDYDILSLIGDALDYGIQDE